MRLYFFNNMMLSQIQHGIQAGHAAVDLLLKYDNNNTLDHVWNQKAEMVKDWAHDHKTFIVLNGGVSDSLYSLRRLLEDPLNPYPWVGFKEPNIANALTSLAVLLPESAYKLPTDYAMPTRPDLDPQGVWEARFQAIKASCPLA